MYQIKEVKKSYTV